MFDARSVSVESFNLAIWDLVFDEQQRRSGVLLKPKNNDEMIRDELQTSSNQFQIIVDKLNEDAGFRKIKMTEIGFIFFSESLSVGHGGRGFFLHGKFDEN